jgi:hypothetical protein
MDNLFDDPPKTTHRLPCRPQPLALDPLGPMGLDPIANGYSPSDPLALDPLSPTDSGARPVDAHKNDSEHKCA